MRKLTSLSRRYFGVAGSNWIYASSYEQILQTTSKGRLRFLPSVRQIHDLTVRMHSVLTEADVVLCEDYERAANLLHSLSNKLARIEPQSKRTQIVKTGDQLEEKPSDELIQLSEHLKFKIEYAKTAGEPLDVGKVVSEQEYIRQHTLKQTFRKKINEHKETNGFGYVISLEKEPDLRVIDYIKEGFNISYMYEECGHHLQKILLQAEEYKIPYEILPGPCELVTALSASGYPADRFAIEYFPCRQGTEKLDILLTKRKMQNFSVAIMETQSNLEKLLRRVSATFGQYQSVYVVTHQEAARREVRMPVGSCLALFEKSAFPNKQVSEQRCIVVVSPNSMDYNQQLKEQMFQVNKATEDINDEDEELSTHKLIKLEAKIRSFEQPTIHRIQGTEAARYLLSLVTDEEQATHLLGRLLRVGSKDARRLMSSAKQAGNDVLQIEHSQLKKRK